MRYKYEVVFRHKRMCPEYGEEAYTLEQQFKCIPFGAREMFKKGDDAFDYIKKKLTPRVLRRYFEVSVVKWNGCNGVTVFRNTVADNSSLMSIDRKYIDRLFAEV